MANEGKKGITRREFIKKVGYSTAAVGLASTAPLLHPQVPFNGSKGPRPYPFDQVLVSNGNDPNLPIDTTMKSVRAFHSLVELNPRPLCGWGFII